MKFHWGHGIFAFYVVFVAVLVTVVIKSRQFDNSLVYEDYYVRDMNYQQEFDRRQNSDALANPLRVEYSASGPALQFPEQELGEIEGRVHLYRPSTKIHDRHATIADVQDGRMALDVAGLPAGRYRAIVEWERAGVGYHDEVELTLKP